MSKQEAKCPFPKQSVTLGFHIGFNLRSEDDEEEAIIVSPLGSPKLWARTIKAMEEDLEIMREIMDDDMRERNPERFALLTMIDEAKFKVDAEGISVTFCLTESQAEELRSEWMSGAFNPDVFHEFTVEGKEYQGEWFYKSR